MKLRDMTFGQLKQYLDNNCVGNNCDRCPFGVLDLVINMIRCTVPEISDDQLDKEIDYED